MAITFTTPIPTDKWLFSEENRIVEFSSDYTEVSVYCDITIGSLAELRLYPLPNNTFWANLKSFISPILRNYADDIDPSTIDETDINNFIFDWSRVFLNEEINFTITFADSTTETASVTPFIVLGAEQIYNYKRLETVENLESFILSPLKRNTSERFYLKYWDGYPFDFCISRNIFTLDTTQNLTNITNGITSPDFSTPYNINRIFISNGDTNASLEDYLPLVIGYNEIKTNDDNYIDLYKIKSDCGVYIKWLNNNGGGYNYWLFNRQNKIDKTIRTLGIINNDFYNKEDTISQTRQQGKTSKDTQTVQADSLNVFDIDLIKGILTSPKVYLFTGERFTKNSFNDWLEIDIKNSRVNIKDPKNSTNNINIQFEMPNEYNILI